jgi:hypothetical protein
MHDRKRFDAEVNILRSLLKCMAFQHTPYSDEEDIGAENGSTTLTYINLKLSIGTEFTCAVKRVAGASRCDDDAATTVAVNIDQSSVHVGDNVTLTCRVASPSSNSVTGLQWRKSTVAGDYNEEIIAEGEKLTRLYSEYGDGRYEVVLVPVYEVTYYILHIYCTFTSLSVRELARGLRQLTHYCFSSSVICLVLSHCLLPVNSAVFIACALVEAGASDILKRLSVVNNAATAVHRNAANAENCSNWDKKNNERRLVN